MKTRVSILFWFRKGRLPEAEKQAMREAAGQRFVDAVTPERVGVINCRITVRGEKINFATGITAIYAQWDGKAQKVLGAGPEASRGNRILAKLRNDLYDIHADLERQRRPVTARSIARLYQNDGAPLDMLGLYDAFLAERKSLIGIEISPKTHEAATIRRKKLGKFFAAHKLDDLRPEEFTHNMGDRFLHWLLITENFQRNTALKSIQMISQVLTWGVRREYLQKNPLAHYRYKMAAPKDIQYLEIEEIEALATTPLAVAALEKVRDCFIFQCWTGLAYADLAALNVAESVSSYQGRRVLRVMRAKSTMFKGYECVIPLLPEAERLLAKYGNTLPVPTNQIYNRYLKQVGELCGMADKHLTTHIGRKTAGVQLLNAGIPMEVVSRVLGHSSVRMTERVYAKILDRTVVAAFNKAFGSLVPTPPPPAPGFEPEAEETRVIQFRFGA